MSGGSWDYVFLKMKACAEALLEDRTLDYEREKPDLNERQREARHRFGHLLVKVAAAMKAIEWVDSSDSSTPSDIEAIEDLDVAVPPEAVEKLFTLWRRLDGDPAAALVHVKLLEEALHLLDHPRMKKVLRERDGG